MIRCVLEREKGEGALGVEGQPGIQETVSKTDEQSHSVLNQGLDLLARALDPHLVTAAPWGSVLGRSGVVCAAQSL